MQVTIDRFEGDFAVVELSDKTMVNMPKALVPGAKEGDVIDININVEATKGKQQKIQKLMNDVWN